MTSVVLAEGSPRSVGGDATDARAPVTLIAGASSGIGRETALLYAQRGARLVLASRSWEALNDVAAVCLRTGAADVLVHVTDLTDRRQVQALFDAALARYGQVDIVISSVGVVAFGRFVDVPLKCSTQSWPPPSSASPIWLAQRCTTSTTAIAVQW